MLGINLKSEFVKNTSYIGISTVIQNIISYLIIVLISRYLGAEGLGQYSFIFAFVGIFFIFSDFGLSQLLIKDLAKDESKIDKYISNILSLKILLLLVCFIIYFVLIFFIGKHELIIAMIIAGIAQIVTQLSQPLFSLGRVKHKSKTVGVALVIERILTLIFSFYTIIILKDLNFFLIGYLIAQIIRTIWLYLSTKKYFNFTLGINKKYILNLIKKSYPFLLIASFAFIYVQMDTIMLSLINGDIVTGWYNAPYKLINVLNVIPAVLLMFGFPYFSKLFHKNKKQAKKLLETILSYSMLLIFPVVVGVFFLGQRIIEFVYKISAIESFIAFKILIIATIFIFLTTILGQFIAACDKQKVFAKIAGIGAAINIILNFALIPKYSLYGAGVATLISYLVMFILMFIYIKKNLLKFRFFRYLILPIVGSATIGIILHYLINLNMIILILISAVFYFLFIIGTKFIKLNKFV